MKKRGLSPVAIIFALLATLILCSLTAFDNRALLDTNKVRSRVYKNELSAQATDEEISQTLVKRMMNKNLPGTLGWYQWIWAYEIKKIDLPEGLHGRLGVVIYVKPFFSDAWRNMWTLEIDRVKDGWVRVGYDMVIDDKGDYYELRGPFTGG